MYCILLYCCPQLCCTVIHSCTLHYRVLPCSNLLRLRFSFFLYTPRRYLVLSSCLLPGSLLHSALLYSSATLCCSALLYSTLLYCSILLYCSALIYFTLATLLCYTVLYYWSVLYGTVLLGCLVSSCPVLLSRSTTLPYQAFLYLLNPFSVFSTVLPA